MKSEERVSFSSTVPEERFSFPTSLLVEREKTELTSSYNNILVDFTLLREQITFYILA